MIEGGFQVSSLYACANQGPVSVTFRAGTQILKLNAKEYYYSSQLHFVLLPDGYRKATRRKYREKERTTNDITNRGRMDKYNKSVRRKDGKHYEPTTYIPLHDL